MYQGMIISVVNRPAGPPKNPAGRAAAGGWPIDRAGYFCKKL
jgi:hypothetical protein